MGSATTWLRHGLLACAVVITSWQVIKIIHRQPVHGTEDAYHADNFSHRIHTKTFDNQGNLVKQLSAQEWVHYPAKDTFFFKEPRVTFHKKNALIWRISANEGRSEQNNTQFQFIHQVHINQPSGIDKAATHIHTESLTYYPKKHVAQTNSGLTLTQPGITLTSQGMILNFITQRINLLAQAQGTYSPSSASGSLSKTIKKNLAPLHHV